MEKKAKSTQTFNKNEIIFEQGEYGSCMYDILAGTVGIFVDYGTESEKQLTVLDSKAYFGEMGMLEAYPRSATAVAMENGTEVEVITADSFADYFDENPEKVLQIMQHMGKRVRALTGDYLDACRAVAEATEAERTGKEKSGWFKTHLKKFLNDYNEGVKIMSQYEVYSPTAVWHW